MNDVWPWEALSGAPRWSARALLILGAGVVDREAIAVPPLSYLLTPPDHRDEQDNR